MQRITAVPIHEVERYFGIARQSGWEITTTGNTGLLAWWADDIARQSGDGHQFYSGADRTRFDNHRHRGVIREHEREDDYRLLPPRLCGVRPPGQIRLPEDPVVIHPPTLDLYLGDCLERMAEVLDHSADLTLVDVPYGGSSHR